MSLAQWTKAILETRDRRQSTVLVSVVGTVLIVATASVLVLSLHHQSAGSLIWRAGVVSLTFALVVWALRAATPLATFFGGLICFLVTLQTERSGSFAEAHSGLAPLLALFVLTFLATKAGKAKKAHLGVSESRRGRNAGQVLANLGAAGLAVLPGSFRFVFHGMSAVILLGVLAEATADTVSSELGTVYGGTPILLTSLRRVAPGTDGAISLLGTLAGCTGAALVTVAGAWSMSLTAHYALAAFAGGVAGLLFDSLLGATFERQGWLGNDWVNFLSTVAGGLTACAVAAL